MVTELWFLGWGEKNDSKIKVYDLNIEDCLLRVIDQNNVGPIDEKNTFNEMDTDVDFFFTGNGLHFIVCHC